MTFFTYKTNGGFNCSQREERDEELLLFHICFLPKYLEDEATVNAIKKHERAAFVDMTSCCLFRLGFACTRVGIGESKDNYELSASLWKINKLR